MTLRFTALTLSAIPLVLFACGGADETPINQPGTDSGGADTSNPNTDGGGNPDTSTNDSSATPDSGLTCNAPMANCSGNPADGCNIDLSKDNANCGGCGVVCNTQCTNGVCPLIGGDSGVPNKVGDFACIAVDSKNVYWSTGLLSNAGGAVWSVPINGGQPNQVVGMQDRPHGIASDGTNVYYANFSNGNNGAIYRVATGGGAPATIATGQALPFDVVVDNTTVYWTNSGDGTIWASDKMNPNPKKLGGGGGQGHAISLKVDGTNVYWTDAVSGVVNRMPKAGGNVTAMSTNGGAPNARYLAIDNSTAYVQSSMNGNSAVLTYPLNASNAAAVQLVTNQFFMQGVATDGTNVYWANLGNSNNNVQPNTGTINRATVSGMNQTPLAKGQNFPGCIALDNQSVYWINLGGGMISKTGK